MPLHEKEEELPLPVLNYYGPQECPGSSRSATSSAIRGSVNTAIPEAATEHSEGPEAAKKDERAIPKAATEHSESRRLLTLASKNSRSGEVATEHSRSPKAVEKDKTAIPEAVTKDKTPIPAAATEHSESSKAIKEDKTAIPEAATEHSEIRRLLILANKESRSGEAAKDHSETPEAACQEMKRPRKSGKGSSSQNQWKQLPIPRKHARTASPDPEEVAG